MRAVRSVGNIFIVLGLTLLLFVVYEEFGTSLVTNHRQTVLADFFDPEIHIGPAPLAPASATPKLVVPASWHGPTPLFKLTIPRLGHGWSRIVVQGVSLYSLAYGPGHYPQTRMPGQVGTVGIACHRTGWGSPCININQMQVGDLIFIDTPAGRYTYRVTSPPKQIEKTDSWVLNGDPSSKDPYKLAITTCTPPHTSLHRMVIWADQISPVPGQSPAPAA
ncbi:MAG TPA: sortase [Actinomycetota bacterium]|nr:sortase [Actinomycetota bacterium]